MPSPDIAERAADPGFDAMVIYARDHGWVDEADRVRAHAEWRDGP